MARRPLYHGYWVDYPDDVPTFWVPDKKAPDGKRTVTKEEFQRLIKVQPAEGDEVTFTAHVRNNGFAPAPETDYRLYIDDKVVATGAIKALAPGQEASIPCPSDTRQPREPDPERRRQALPAGDRDAHRGQDSPEGRDNGCEWRMGHGATNAPPRWR
jgi:hypothetical protein